MKSKNLNILICFCICFMTLFFCSSCGQGSIDYDLVASGNTVQYSTIINMQNTPSKYINKTFKIRGRVGSNGSAYHYMTGTDATNCCNWSIEIRVVDSSISYPNTTNNVIALGTYKSSKVNGRTSYYIQVSDFM